MGQNSSNPLRSRVQAEACEQVSSCPLERSTTTVKTSLQAPHEPHEEPNIPIQPVVMMESDCDNPMDHGLEPAKSDFSPVSASNDGNTFVNSETDQNQSFSAESWHERHQHVKSKKRRFSQAVSTSTSEDEGLHPETKQRVFEMFTGSSRTYVRILDPSLVNLLRGSGMVWPRSYEHEGRLLSPRTSFHEPYEILFHNRRRISDVSERTTGHTAQHARFLLDFMKRVRNTTWEKAFEVEDQECQEISFEDSWLLYPPGETVFCKDFGGWRAYKVDRVELGARLDQDPMQIHAYFLDFDETGESLIPQPQILTVSPYSSEHPVGSLKVVPKWFIQKHMGALINGIIRRGKKYWSYNGKAYYQQYTGNAWPTLGRKTTKVIIDYATASRHDRDDGDAVCPRINFRSCSLCLGETLELGPFPKSFSSHDAVVCMKKSPPIKVSDSSTAEEENILLFCPSLVWAFSLQHKTWKQVQMEQLTNVSCYEKALDQVLMDNDRKDQIDVMVGDFFSARKTGRCLNAISSPRFGRQDRGLSFLFHGHPGTGKTFTAECLAEKHGRPLYKVTCGNLGIEAPTLDTQLQTTFLRAANWDAILLLEEADVFFQERNTNDLKRNALISVFLHHLDVSAALVIITTRYPNRHDIGLESRIHMPLILPDLCFGYQQVIWLSIIKELDMSEIDKNQLERFVKDELESLDEGHHKKLNGLEIESCMRAAVALAKKEQNNDNRHVHLRKEHVKALLTMRREFREYMDKGPSIADINIELLGIGE